MQGDQVIFRQNAKISNATRAKIIPIRRQVFLASGTSPVAKNTKDGRQQGEEGRDERGDECRFSFLRPRLQTAGQQLLTLFFRNGLPVKGLRNDMGRRHPSGTVGNLLFFRAPDVLQFATETL